MSATSTPNKMQKFIDQAWDKSIIPALCEYIKIPNKSPMFDSEWQAHGYMQTAIELLDDWCKNSGIKNLSHRIVTLEGRTPLLFCEIAASSPHTKTNQKEPVVLLYGHYDKQPEFSGWRDGLGPFDPVLKDDRLYGRGGADDGYSLFAALTAIHTLQKFDRAYPRCVFVIEGCEESGSYDLPYYMDLLSDEIGQPDLVICLDAECASYDQLWVTTSLRGTIAGTLTVQVLTEGVHSGAASGIVPSSFRIARELLERIESSRTGLMHEDFYTPIPDKVRNHVRAMATSLGEQVYSKFPWSSSTQPMNEDATTMILNSTWEPTLSVTGISGAPDVSDAGNTLRPETALKLSVRLPPTLNAEMAASKLKSILEDEPPYRATVSFVAENAQSGWAGPEMDERLASIIQRASQQYFNTPMQYMPMGGTIPFIKMLAEKFPNVQFMVTGLLGPESNAHGPNEFLHVQTGKRLTACVAEVLSSMSAET
ncbi:MAG: M20/M25/M40 family metallo-hydrolase [Pseudomonadales bacterium]|nr:M20/M25/M40 family metallo-hydrolase [Pseudomonadales bacterium]